MDPRFFNLDKLAEASPVLAAVCFVIVLVMLSNLVVWKFWSADAAANRSERKDDRDRYLDSLNRVVDGFTGRLDALATLINGAEEHRQEQATQGAAILEAVQDVKTLLTVRRRSLRKDAKSGEKDSDPAGERVSDPAHR